MSYHGYTSDIDGYTRLLSHICNINIEIHVDMSLKYSLFLHNNEKKWCYIMSAVASINHNSKLQSRILQYPRA